ncbi:MAG: membrane protein insertion efficiency factor YidD [Candidatus Marinimicrobia bacterium]|nr:membrane protein insertion efficiency factor YidD [Candidatus Neomarinimicrobiota bacterium]
MAIFVIGAYRKLISPFTGNNCRYHPTCSEYAVGSYRRFSFFVASRMVALRLFSCHPWGGHGYDPVPDNQQEDSA